jgi:hypothetical protein
MQPSAATVTHSSFMLFPLLLLLLLLRLLPLPLLLGSQS